MKESRDQSIQVDFPIVVRTQERHLRKYYTSGDLKSPSHNSSRNAHQSGQWAILSRPKSLHLALDTTPIRSRLTCGAAMSRQRSIDSPMSSMGSEATATEARFDKSPAPSIYSVTKEKLTSSEPSLVYSHHVGTLNHNKWQEQKKCTCHCSKLPKSNYPNTPEGLSWRRLHMSRAKLKATATTSELLSGFAMIAMVELQITEPTTVPEWLFVLFAVCTTILVAVHIFALMISTYLLPNIDAISKLEVYELVAESPHERMRGFIELAWAFSTILGLFLFLVEIAILCWVKFWDYSVTAAMAATIIVIPVLIIFVVFAIHFYHSLVIHKFNTSVTDIKQLEDMKKELDGNCPV